MGFTLWAQTYVFFYPEIGLCRLELGWSARTPLTPMVRLRYSNGVEHTSYLVKNGISGQLQEDFKAKTVAHNESQSILDISTSKGIVK